MILMRNSFEITRILFVKCTYFAMCRRIICHYLENIKKIALLTIILLRRNGNCLLVFFVTGGAGGGERGKWLGEERRSFWRAWNPAGAGRRIRVGVQSGRRARGCRRSRERGTSSKEEPITEGWGFKGKESPIQNTLRTGPDIRQRGRKLPSFLAPRSPCWKIRALQLAGCPCSLLPLNHQSHGSGSSISRAACPLAPRLVTSQYGCSTGPHLHPARPQTSCSPSSPPEGPESKCSGLSHQWAHTRHISHNPLTWARSMDGTFVLNRLPVNSWTGFKASYLWTLPHVIFPLRNITPFCGFSWGNLCNSQTPLHPLSPPWSPEGIRYPSSTSAHHMAPEDMLYRTGG